MAQAADSGMEPWHGLSGVANKWASCRISLLMISDPIFMLGSVIIVDDLC